MENDDPMNIDQAPAPNPPPANLPPANPQAGIHLDPQISHQVSLALAQLNDGDPPLPPDPPAPPLPDCSGLIPHVATHCSRLFGRYIWFRI
jgi:hypothetical protein